jgi:hypothetical protein
MKRCVKIDAGLRPSRDLILKLQDKIFIPFFTAQPVGIVVGVFQKQRAVFRNKGSRLAHLYPA